MIPHQRIFSALGALLFSTATVLAQRAAALAPDQVRRLWATAGAAPAPATAPRAFDPDLNDGLVRPPAAEPPARDPAPAAWRAGALLHRDDFADLSNWLVEQKPGGTVTVRDGALVIDDAGGCTVWFRPELAAPVVITYEATVLDRGGAHDRVSDLNCFWMATDPGATDGSVLATTAKRTGAFADYDALRLYYVGYGGNTNTTTRFRRYLGNGEKPLLPEFDRTGAAVLLKGNVTSKLMLVAAGGRAQFFRDGEKLFDFADPSPLTRGRFGFRTVQSRIEFRNFRVWRAEQTQFSMPQR